jgi:ribosomal protein L3 glutamine methyltransferase
MAALPHEYRREPLLALAGGADGLDIVRTILASATEHLNQRGVLVVEIGHNREVLEQAYPRLPFLWLNTSAGPDLVFLLERANLF